MFKIEYRHQTHENSSIDYLIQTQTLSLREIHMINNVKKLSWSGELIRNQLSSVAVSTPCVAFVSLISCQKILWSWQVSCHNILWYCSIPLYLLQEDTVPNYCDAGNLVPK